jgi:hypothetical protein
LHRTAHVKHHLRAMAGDGADRHMSSMLTTYEHDFGCMTRPNQMGRSTSFGAGLYGTGGKAGTFHRDTMRAVSEHRDTMRASRIAAPKAYHDEDMDDARSIRSSANLGSRERDVSGTLGPGTLSKMHSMQSKGDPMRLTVNSWGDARWQPKTHPHMVNGFTLKRCDLMKNCDIMNLRAPDVPFTTR